MFIKFFFLIQLMCLITYVAFIFLLNRILSSVSKNNMVRLHLCVILHCISLCCHYTCSQSHLQSLQVWECKWICSHMYCCSPNKHEMRSHVVFSYCYIVIIILFFTTKPGPQSDVMIQRTLMVSYNLFKDNFFNGWNSNSQKPEGVLNCNIFIWQVFLVS